MIRNSPAYRCLASTGTAQVLNRNVTCNFLRCKQRHQQSCLRSSSTRQSPLTQIRTAAAKAAQEHHNNTIPIYHDSTQYMHQPRHTTHHPENPSRVDVCLETLRQHSLQEELATRQQQLYKLVDVSPLKEAPYFTNADLKQARRMLVKAHSEAYVQNIQDMCASDTNEENSYEFLKQLDADTYITTQTYNVSLRAMACWLKAVDDVLTTDNKPTSHHSSTPKGRYSMALTRPPGHHATQTTANGFCLFNFAAAAALYALEVLDKRDQQQQQHQHTQIQSQSQPSCKPPVVSVLDWDVHYGQGVADILQHHPRTRYASIHQLHAFPHGLGTSLERWGMHGNVLTIPVSPVGTTWENGYRQAFEEVLLPFVAAEFEEEAGNGEVWIPEVVIVCAGFDALKSDPLASVELRVEDYGRMLCLLKQRLRDVYGKNEIPRIVLGLEGGYQLQGEDGLKEAFLETVLALGDENEA